MGNCAQTAVRIPCSPARIAICSEPEPTQWPNACRSSRPGHLEDLADRGRPVHPGDVVDRELGPRRRQVDAGPVVEQPDVVAAASARNSVRFCSMVDARNECDDMPNPVAMHRAAPCRRPGTWSAAGTRRRRAGRRRATAGGRRTTRSRPGRAGSRTGGRRSRRARERPHLVEDAAVDVHHLVGEQLEERPPVLALLPARYPVDLDAAEQLGQVGGLQVEDPGPRRLARPAR